MSPRLHYLAVIAAALPLGGLLAQTDAPPEQQHASAPTELKPVPSPTPVIRGKLTVEFPGATAFPIAKLRDSISFQIETIEKGGLDDPNAYDAAFFLESFYRKQGYSQAEVAEHITGPWSLRLVVNQGPFTRLGTVTITGDKAYDTPTLMKYLLGPLRERFPRVRRDILLPFYEPDIDSGADLIERLYASNGYLDAKIDPPAITWNADKSVANVGLSIHEGLQFRFSSIRITGNAVFPQGILLTAIREDTKDVYTEGRLMAAQRKLEDYYKARGYFKAAVTATSNVGTATDGHVTAVFQVAPGAIYRFGTVSVSGNPGVKTSFLQKRLKNLQNKVYDPKLIDKNFRMLIETGLFTDLRITPHEAADDTLALNVSAEAAKPKEFGFGIGYASYYGGIFNISYTDRNLFNDGRSAGANVEVTQKSLGGDITYSDPWFLDTKVSLKVRIYALNATLRGYSKYEIGIQPSLAYSFNDHFQVSAFLLLKGDNLYGVDITPPNLVGPDSYSVGSFGISQTLDYRNNTTLPTAGWILGASEDVAPNGFGDISFIRAIGRFSYYIPVTAKSSLALGARAGIISPLSGAEFPIDERFFNGGATTVRSFAEFDLGPQSGNGYPVGGEGFTVFNVEYDFPLIGDLQGAVFFDAGNVIAEASKFGVEDMSYAVGAGFRYNLPIGAIRLDYGVNPFPRDGQSTGALQFAIGVAF